MDNPDQNYDDGVAYAPAIAVPLAVKASFACPDDHLQRFKDLLPTADRILIVGWRAGEAHVRELLAAIYRGPNVLVVSRTEDSASAVIATLRSAGLRANYMPLGGGFSGLHRTAALWDFVGGL
jgi:hypothetical protein